MESAGGCNVQSNDDVVQSDYGNSQLSAPSSQVPPNSGGPNCWTKKANNNAKSRPYYSGRLPANSTTFLTSSSSPPQPGFPISCYEYCMPNYYYTPPLQLFASTKLPLPYVTQFRFAITKQIEYYFSDDNLAKDVYLRRNMDEEGWVPIKLIAGFKRVSELTDDALFARDSLIYSTTVEVQGEYIRKRGTWKKWLLPKA